MHFFLSISTRPDVPITRIYDTSLNSHQFTFYSYIFIYKYQYVLLWEMHLYGFYTIYITFPIYNW